MTATAETYYKRFAENRCCVIIPTYNNEHTLARVIHGVLKYSDQVIVVDDGSTDSTSSILAGFPLVNVIRFPVNQGKGMALRAGFKMALEKGFLYAITIDSDGQHFPEDLPRFLEMMEARHHAIIIGARNMSQDGVPGTSNFGHKFSNFWFRVETGHKVLDTQSGYRVYPVYNLKNIRFFTRRFEFEVEVLVRAAWKGIRVMSVPVNIYYAPKEERVSHFRKFTDFARISVLNTILVLIALLYVRPFHFFRDVRKKGFKRYFQEQVIQSKDSNRKIAFSVFIGIFIGTSPIWGWQLMAAIALAYTLRLNKFATILTANISIPPMLPVILFLSYITGGFVLGAETSDFHYEVSSTFSWIRKNLVQYLVGSVVFGLILGFLASFTTYLLLGIFRKKGSANVQS